MCVGGGVKWLFPIQYLSYNSVFDLRDLIGQAHELSGGEGESVKCVWEEETDLEFIANEACTHYKVQFHFHESINEPSKNF